MKRVKSIVAEREYAGPGMWAFVGEAEVEVDTPNTPDKEGGHGTRTVYVHVSDYDGMWNYVVSEESLLDGEDSAQGNEKADTDTDGGVLNEEFFSMSAEDKLKYLDEHDGELAGASSGSKYLEEYSTRTGTKGSGYWKVFDAVIKAVNAVGTDFDAE